MTATDRWARVRWWAWRTAGVVLAIACMVFIAWVARQLAVTRSQALVAYAVASFLWLVWLSLDRANLFDRADEMTDLADRAHERIDAIGERQRATHSLASDALAAIRQLRDEHRDHRHPLERPVSVRERTDTGPGTTEVPAIPRAAQRPPEPRTIPRPAIDLAGGARIGGATASGRGRHAAPDDDRQAGAQ